MQTFLPHADFTLSAQQLDFKRLGKQRVEALQILRAIESPTYGWQKHPAVRMWRATPGALVMYGLAICLEWEVRGYRDSVFHKILYTAKANNWPWEPPYELPTWWNEKIDAVSASHRAALLFKNPEHYSKFGWTEEPRISYVWPV